MKKTYMIISLLLAILVAFSACGSQPNNDNSNETTSNKENNVDTKISELQEMADKVYRAYLFVQCLVDVTDEEEYFANIKPNIETLYKYALMYKFMYSSAEEMYNDAENVGNTVYYFRNYPEDFLPVLNTFHFVKTEIKNTYPLTEEEFETFHINDMPYSFDDFSEILKLEINTEVDLGDYGEDKGYINNYFPEKTPQYNIAGKLGGNWYLWYPYPWGYSEHAEHNK